MKDAAKADLPAVVVGIDPGNEGGIVALGLDGRFRASARMPVVQGKRPVPDPAAIARFLRDLKKAAEVRLVAIEQVSPRPGEGGVQAFAFGRGLGKLEGVVAALRLPTELVPPQTWQKGLPAGVAAKPVPKGLDAKAARAARSKAQAEFKRMVVAAALQRWPRADLVASPSKQAGPTSGLADAIWIAEWARRQLVGQQPTQEEPCPKPKKSSPRRSIGSSASSAPASKSG